MEDHHHLLTLQGVLFLRKLKLQIVIGPTPFQLWRSFSGQFYSHGFFSFDLSRLSSIYGCQLGRAGPTTCTGTARPSQDSGARVRVSSGSAPGPPISGPGPGGPCQAKNTPTALKVVGVGRPGRAKTAKIFCKKPHAYTLTAQSLGGLQFFAKTPLTGICWFFVFFAK